MPLEKKYPFYITFPAEKVFSNCFAHAMQNFLKHAFTKMPVKSNAGCFLKGGNLLFLKTQYRKNVTGNLIF